MNVLTDREFVNAAALFLFTAYKVNRGLYSRKRNQRFLPLSLNLKFD